MVRRVDLQLDQAMVIKIAEIVLVKVYGKEVFEERPWHVSSNGKVFRVCGTLKAEKGGVAEIEISRKNAEVVSIIHGK